MAIVIGFKVDPHSGFMICDEEDWIIRRRRIFYGDFIYPLISEEVSNEFQVEALYGGVGSPTLTYNVYLEARKKIDKIYDEYKNGSGKKISSLDSVGEIFGNILQKEIAKRVNFKLKALYGFEKDDLIQGYFHHKGEKYEIAQEEVKKKALEFATVPETGHLEERHLEHKALLFGYDRANGIALYGFEHTNPTLYLTAGPFEVRGTGPDEKDAAQLVLADFVNRKPLNIRKRGFDRVEVARELIRACYESSVHNQEVGGYFNLIYLDGTGKDQKSRVRKISDEAVKIATELVIGEKYGQLDKNTVYDLINKLIFEDKNPDLVETIMFQKAKTFSTFELILRGYKADNPPEIKPDYTDWYSKENPDCQKNEGGKK